SWTVDDPVVQHTPPIVDIGAPLKNFDGVGQGLTGPQGTFTVNAAPPDTNGDVGPNHYVQIVNTDFAVFNKSTGAVIYGPVPIKPLWAGFGGACESDNDGDPIVQYDPLADRWLISQFAVTGGPPYFQCVAVSTSPDPTGTWNRYSFQYSTFNDYPKIGVWPDAYYITYNMFSGNSFAGGQVCAFDRARMLSGAMATAQCFSVGPNFGGLLAADLDGTAQPAPGTPNPVIALDTNALQIWKFHVDWTTPSNSRLDGPTALS